MDKKAVVHIHNGSSTFSSLKLNGSDGKASVCNAGDPGLIPGLGRSPGEGNGNPLQYSCLENSMHTLNISARGPDSVHLSSCTDEETEVRKVRSFA